MQNKRSQVQAPAPARKSDLKKAHRSKGLAETAFRSEVTARRTWRAFFHPYAGMTWLRLELRLNENSRYHPRMPSRLRRLLHRAVHLVGDTGHARWKAGHDTLRAT